MEHKRISIPFLSPAHLSTNMQHADEWLGSMQRSDEGLPASTGGTPPWLTGTAIGWRWCRRRECSAPIVFSPSLDSCETTGEIKGNWQGKTTITHTHTQRDGRRRNETHTHTQTPTSSRDRFSACLFAKNEFSDHLEWEKQVQRTGRIDRVEKIFFFFAFFVGRAAMSRVKNNDGRKITKKYSKQDRRHSLVSTPAKERKEMSWGEQQVIHRIWITFIAPYRWPYAEPTTATWRIVILDAYHSNGRVCIVVRIDIRCLWRERTNEKLNSKKNTSFARTASPIRWDLTKTSSTTRQLQLGQRGMEKEKTNI